MIRSAVALGAVLLGACSVASPVTPIPEPEGAASSPLEPGPALAIWPADDALEALALDAAARIEAASGLVVDVGPDVPDAIPLMGGLRPTGGNPRKPLPAIPDGLPTTCGRLAARRTVGWGTIS